ncbi:hypothetical protein INR49_029759 [Caranx melampygus]|nr:hypothetical protein INR49_029759 [Caranx melampygus]
MKEILVLLVLLSAQTAKVCSQPYKVDSDGNCRNSTSEYLPDDSDLCCKKCRPGEHLEETCTETTDSVCVPCGPGLFIENWNFAQNCFSCEKCKPRTANSNVRCRPCRSGTFSATLSDTEPCQPHTKCHGSAVVREGNTTSDTVCEHQGVTMTTQPQKTTKAPDTSSVFMTSSTMSSTVLAVSDSTLAALKEVFNHSTKSPPAEPDNSLGGVIGGVTGTIFFILFIFILLLYFCKHVWKEDTAPFHPKVDANGNCESGDKINHSYLGETQVTPMTVYSPEEQCLLGNGEACSDHSLSNNNTESLTQTEGCNSHESIGPLQSTAALNNSYSALSEPMTLISNAEPVIPLPSGPSQSPCQPTSPQIISPITTSPHVNVNITFHIGNGSSGMPSLIPTNLNEPDCKLPFGEEEKSYSIPQQEDGKQSQISVQDSESYSL